MGMIEMDRFLNVTRVREHHHVGDAEEAAGYNAGHFQAVEVLVAYLREDTQQGSAQTAGPNGSESTRLDFGRHEERVPACGPNPAIERKTVDRANHAPVLRVGIALQPQALAHERSRLDQNRANLNT